jgi:RHS repeat-associated protein
LLFAFTASAVNGFGQYTGYTLGNGKASQTTYHYGTPTRFYTAGIQDLNLTFDYTKGNLTSRRDAIKNITEGFTYDNLNRLTGTTVNSVQQLSMAYDGTTSSSLGNITNKTDAGAYTYKTDKINAVAYITNPAGPTADPVTISKAEQQISYTPFLKTATITEGNYNLSYTYGPEYQRVKSVLKQGTTTLETRYYLGSYEKQVGGTTREIHYVSGGNGLCAMIVKEGSTVNIYYVYTDHLGSLVTVTNSTGTVVAEQNFDAWGRNRNAVTWQYTAGAATPAWLYRGYTGHELAPHFALINMNGRMYDPVQGRMLSPDNYVSTPFGTQGYNRYAYAMNNPLIITDPDGNFAFVPIIIGAAVGAFFGGIQADMQGESFWSGAWKGAIVGAAGGAIGGALAGTFSSWGMVGSGIAQGAITGFATGGLSSTLNGTNFMQGALNGALWGGIMGGASGAIKRLSLGSHHDMEIPAGEGNDLVRFESQQELEEYINKNIGNLNKIESTLKTDITLAGSNNLPRSDYTMRNYMLIKPDGVPVGGATILKGGWLTRLESRVFISPGLKGSISNGVNAAKMGIAHELIHAYHAVQKLPGYDLYTERAAAAYSLNYAKAYNMAPIQINSYRLKWGWYPKSFSWSNLAKLGIINFGLTY